MFLLDFIEVQLNFAYWSYSKLIISNMLSFSFFIDYHHLRKNRNHLSSFLTFCFLFIYFIFQYESNKISRRACTVLLHYPDPSWNPLEFGTILEPTRVWHHLVVVVHSSLHTDGNNSGSVVDCTSGKHQRFQEIPG